MNLLVDTQYLIWMLIEPERVRPEIRALFEHESTKLYFSVASLWEIAIKRALNKPDFTIDVEPFRIALFKAGFVEMPILSEHILQLAKMPPVEVDGKRHKDPFDRLLVAQAEAQGITFLTSDALLGTYSRWVRVEPYA